MDKFKNTELRKRAEKILREKGVNDAHFYQENLEKLVEELNIYQIELEHQNEELQQIQSSLEQTNQKFSDLYHNAPVGYFNIDKNFRVVDVNEKGLEMLKSNSNEILNSKFTDYIHPDSQNKFYLHHRQIISTKENDICEIKLIDSSGKNFEVKLESIAVQGNENAEAVMRTAVSDITARKKIEREHNRQLRILRNISDSVIVTDLNGKITFWNQGAEEIFGYGKDEMIGKTPAILYPDMDPSKLDYDLNKIIAGEDYIGEWKGSRKDGKSIWVHIRTSVLLDNEDQPVGFLGVSKEITKEKELSEKIFIENQQTRTYFDMAGVMLMVIDKKGIIQDINRVGCNLLETSKDNVVGKEWFNHFLPAEIKDDVKRFFTDIMSDKEVMPDYNENLMVTGKGNIRIMGWYHSVLRDPKGNPIGLLISGEDITKRKEIEEYKSELTSIVENSEDGIESLDLKGVVVSWNKGAEKIYGYKASEMIGKKASLLYGKKELKELEEAIKSIRLGKLVRYMETKRKRKNGKVIDVAITFSPLRDKEGNVYGISVLTRDISKQKESEKKLEQSEKKYRAIFENSGDGFLLMTDKIVDCNKRLCELFGYSCDEIIGKHPVDFSPEKQEDGSGSKELSLQYIKKALSEGYNSFRWQHIKKDGEIIESQITLNRIQIGDKNHLMAVVHDLSDIISYQKSLKEKSEEILAQNEEYVSLNEELSEANEQLEIVNKTIEKSEEKFRIAFKTSPEAISITRLSDGKYLEINDGFSNITGYSEDEIKGIKSSEIGIWKNINDRKKIISELEKKGHVINYEAAFVSKKGKTIHGLFSASIIEIENEKCLLSVTRDITKIKESQEQIARQEHYLRTLIQTNRDGFWVIDHKQNLVDVNEAYCKMTGYSRRELLKMKIQDIDAEENPKDTEKRLRKIKQTGSDVFETKHRRKDGKNIDVEISVTYLDVNGGHFICFCKDITKRKANEEKINDFTRYLKIQNEISKSFIVGEGDEFFKLVLDIIRKYLESPFGYFGYINEKGDFVSSSMTYDIWDKCMVKDKSIIFPKESWKGIWGESLNKKKTVVKNEGLVVPEGHIQLNSALAVPIINDTRLIGQIVIANKIGGYSEKDVQLLENISNDLSNLLLSKLREEKYKNELIESRNQAEKKEYHSHVVALLSKQLINKDLSVEKMSRLVYKYALELTGSRFGYVSTIDQESGDNVTHTLSEMLGDQCNIPNQQAVFPKGEKGYNGLYGVSLNTKKPMFTNNPEKHASWNGLPEGHVPIDNFLAVPVVIDDQLLGQIAVANKGVNYSQKDVKVVEELANIFGLAVYRNRVEKELVLSKEKAEESDRLKTSFLQNMSHEIRTPMNAIVGFSRLLKKTGLSEEKHDSYANIVVSSSNQLLSIVSNILTISALESNQERLDSGKTCVNDIIVEMVSVFKHKAAEQNVGLYATQQLTDRRSVIYTDETKLRQILTNLISNALKFTSEGQIEIGYSLEKDNIKISWKEALRSKEKVYMKFFVKDEGIGMSEEERQRIFNRFIQANETISKKFGGTGLGLAISKGFIDLMGGKIWVDSKPGEGSVFYFTIPYDPVYSNFEEIQSEENHDKLNILVAEDEQFNYLYIEELIHDMGHDILHARNGEEAVEMCKSDDTISLILMDIKMPVMNGMEAAKEIHKLRSDLPIIAQSAYALEDEVEKYSGPPFSAYLTKPLDQEVLKEKIKEVMNGS